MSIKLEWDDRYNIGNSDIDAHHRKLFSFMNIIESLLDKYSENQDPTDEDSELLTKTIEELCDYTDYHFGLEEKLMKEHSYNKLPEHIELHKKFRDDVYAFQGEVSLLGPCQMMSKILSSLKEWLINHILFVDQDYARSLK
jgi:hemerythrin